MLELGDNPQRLAFWSNPLSTHGIGRILARMSKGRVTLIMRKRQGFGEILIQPDHPGNGACDLCHLSECDNGCEIVPSW